MLPAASVPEVMFVALVVSVVALGAKPDELVKEAAMWYQVLVNNVLLEVNDCD